MKHIIEFLYALRIIASPFLVGLISGFLVFLWLKNMLGLLIGISLACIGLAAGIYFLLNVKKNFQASEFINRNASINELNSES